MVWKGSLSEKKERRGRAENMCLSGALALTVTSYYLGISLSIQEGKKGAVAHGGVGGGGLEFGPN